METGEQKSDRLLSLEKERERAYEYGLPEYLQHDLDGAITPEHAEYLRQKYLWR